MSLSNFKSPVAWLRESLAPNVRQKNTEEEIEAARKQAAQKDQLSVFESVPTIEKSEKGEEAFFKQGEKPEVSQVKGRDFYKGTN